LFYFCSHSLVIRSPCHPPSPAYLGSMEKMVIRAFRKWCRENVGRGEKPCGQHAAEFFFTLGATEKDA